MAYAAIRVSGEIHYLSAFPELLVTDLEESLDWYRDVLGFKPLADWPDGRHLRRSDGQDIVLRQAVTMWRTSTMQLSTRLALGPGLMTKVVEDLRDLQFLEVTAEGIGRNAAELLRKVKAAQYVAAHPGEVCPAKWQEGEKTLAPSLDLVGKI